MVPEGVLGYLSRATAQEGCHLLSEWAADGCAGIAASAPEDADGIDGGSSSPLDCESNPESQSHQLPCSLCSRQDGLCTQHATLQSVLLAFGRLFLDDLEALLQVCFEILALVTPSELDEKPEACLRCRTVRAAPVSLHLLHCCCGSSGVQ